MVLPIIYVSFILLTTILFFSNKSWDIKYKKWLIWSHIVSLLLLSLDIFLISEFNSSYKGIWADRFFASGFLISGVAIFTLYRKSLRLWAKIYFGLFFYYPALAALTFIIDRIMFLIVAGPLLVCFSTPEIYFSNKDFDIRTVQGLMAPKQLVLIEKGMLIEKEFGKSEDNFSNNANYKNFKIIANSGDSITISVDSNRRREILTFKK